MRETVAYITANGQAGLPPGVTTDAQLEYSVTACRGAEILSGSREGDGSILGRLEESCARAHPGTKNGSARGAEAGYCPRCAQATHVAVPARRKAPEFPNENSRATLLLSDWGPWACTYAKSLDHLPQIWDKATQLRFLTNSETPCAPKVRPAPHRPTYPF